MTRKEISLIVGGVLVALLLLAALVYSVPVFKLQTVEVEGMEHLTQEEVETASGVVEGENLVRFSAPQAAAGIAELPWVKTVTVERNFPSTVHIDITERQVVAFAQAPDGQHLIDSDGAEFLIAPPPPEAVELRGAAPNSDNWRGAIEILAVLPPFLREYAQAIDTADRYNYVIIMDDERTVTWGANEDNKNKARAMEAGLKLEGAHINVTNPELVTTR